MRSENPRDSARIFSRDHVGGAQSVDRPRRQVGVVPDRHRNYHQRDARLRLFRFAFGH
jgi:hypothetical protein